jgi:hypothetical protein
MTSEDLKMIILDHRNYVPILKWRQGEYQALMRLEESVKNVICPLIEVCPPGFDFETWTRRKNIDDQLADFSKRLVKKWHNRPAFVDFKLLDTSERMSDGRHPIDFVLSEARFLGASIVPVTGLNRNVEYQNAIADGVKIDGKGACIRVELDDLSSNNFDDNIFELANVLNLQMQDIDLLVDLSNGNFEPLDGLTEIISTIIHNSSSFSRARNSIIAGTAFPNSMKDVVKDGHIMRRHEWLLYKELVDRVRLRQRIPTFSDYAIASPNMPNMDMRMIRVAATVRYTIDDAWLIIKGLNVRDHKYDQYRNLCRLVVDSPHYLGSKFSLGSNYIERCMRGQASTGQLTTWRWVGTNHHISKVTHDLASFHGS